MPTQSIIPHPHEQPVSFGWLGKTVAGVVIAGFPALLGSLIFMWGTIRTDIALLKSRQAELLERVVNNSGPDSPFILRRDYLKAHRDLEEQLLNLRLELAYSQRLAVETKDQGVRDRTQIKALIERKAREVWYPRNNSN